MITYNGSLDNVLQESTNRGLAGGMNQEDAYSECATLSLYV